MLVARGLPCPVGVVRSGKKRAVVVKTTFRLDGSRRWAPTQAPLREAVSDEFGRLVFPSDFQLHKTACDVVLAGATLSAHGPAQLHLGDRTLGADDPRSLGPVPAATSGRTGSFAPPRQQLSDVEFPFRVEAQVPGAHGALALPAQPARIATVSRGDWGRATEIALTLDAVLVDPVREVVELVLRGRLIHDGDDVLLLVSAQPFTADVLREACRWTQVNAVESASRGVGATSFDADEETFVGARPNRAATPGFAVEPTQMGSPLDHAFATSQDAGDAESTAVRARPRPATIPDVETTALHAATSRATIPDRETTVMHQPQSNDAAAPGEPPAASFAWNTAPMPIVAGPTFEAESTRLHELSPAAREPDLPFGRETLDRMPACDPSGGAPNAALPFRESGRPAAPRASVPPDLGLPFKQPGLAAPPLPTAFDAAPSAPPPANAAASRTLADDPTPEASDGLALSPPPVVGLGLAPLQRAATPSTPPAAPPPPAPASPPEPVFAPVIVPTAVTVDPALLTKPAPIAAPAEPEDLAFRIDGMTLVEFASLRARLWRGEPRREVLKERKLNEIRYRVLERKWQRYLDELPPTELQRALEVMGAQ